MAEPVVRMRGISKSFGRARVLDGVDLDLRRGEIHALVGGNGAGKSTLMKILVGVHAPDGGSYAIDGQDARFASIHDAIAARVGMVFQEFSLIPQLTVAQNIYLTREPRTRRGFIDDRSMVSGAREIFETMNVAIDPRRTLADLPTAQWQLTEIAKALSQDAHVLILDEPTAALAKSEADELLELLRRLRDRGIAIVYISHRMDEILSVSEHVTVLRDGSIAVSRPTADLTMTDIITAIVGQDVEHSFDWHARAVGDDILLEARGLTSDRLRGIDLDLRGGEVLGLAGLMGSGRTELARALFGIDRLHAGEVRLAGAALPPGDPIAAIDAGLALIPEDRRLQGLILDHSVRDNLLLPMIRRLGRAGIVDDRRGDSEARRSVERLDIRTRSARQPSRELSGGNQQKIVIAKWLAMKPRVLIMDEPTAGVDIATKTEIVAMIRGFADAGGGVIMISSELPELLAVSDRLLVLRDGAVETEIDRRAIHHEADLHHAVQGTST